VSDILKKVMRYKILIILFLKILCITPSVVVI